MTLPGSRLEISYSTKYHKFLPSDTLVIPDQEFLPTWADWVAGRDPVLDWIVKQQGSGLTPLCQYVAVAQTPRVTAIIPTYNWSSVLRYSIGSALAQTFTDFELLVIGDGCTDDSEEVVGRIGDPRVRWINLPENTRHQSGPNNEGLRQARGEIIAYLGHDDLWLPHHLASLVKALDATGSDLAYSLSVNVAPDGRVWPTIPRPEEGTFASPLCVVHRRRVTEVMGGWRHYRELMIGPDVELWQRAHVAGYRFAFVPRLTGIKFPGGWRRDVYKTRP